MNKKANTGILLLAAIVIFLIMYSGKDKITEAIKIDEPIADDFAGEFNELQDIEDELSLYDLDLGGLDEIELL